MWGGTCLSPALLHSLNPMLPRITFVMRRWLGEGGQGMTKYEDGLCFLKNLSVATFKSEIPWHYCQVRAHPPPH